MAHPNLTDRVESGRLAEEQAALRRVATLVARGASPAEVFETVAAEVATLLGSDFSLVGRYETDATLTHIASHPLELLSQLGPRTVLDGDDLASVVQRSGKPTSINYDDAPGPVAALARELGVRCAVGAPVVVDDQIWGVMAAGWAHPGQASSEGAERTAEFTELVATALANTESRNEITRLAEGQAALRRVATLVAEGAPPAEVFESVVTEVGQLVPGANAAALSRYETDDTLTMIGRWSRADGYVPVGARYPLVEGTVGLLIDETRRPGRVDVDAEAFLSLPAIIRELGWVSVVGAPIFVQGRLWGLVGISSTTEQSLPSTTEQRLTEFTELVGVAIANAESREALARLADEQAALLRVATLVASGVEPGALFDAIAGEVDALFGLDITAVVRFEDDGTVTVMGAHGGPHSPGARVQLDPEYVVAAVYRTQQAARFDLEDSKGEPPALAQDLGVRSALATPIVVDGDLWGAITVASFEGTFAPGTDRRLDDFSALVATAIADTQARELVTALAEEQAALRRVATLVARGVPPAEIFAAVSREVEGAFDLDAVASDAATVIRFDPGPECVLVGASRAYELEPIGSRWTPKDLYVSTQVLRTRRSARVDEADLESLGGADAEVLRLRGFLYQVGSPIIVEGRLWGAMTLNTGEALPPDTEERLEKFTELIATAISNAEARDGLQGLAYEQAALRRVATLVAEGAQASEVFAAVATEVANVSGLPLVEIARFDPDGWLTVVGSEGDFPLREGTRWPLDNPAGSVAVQETGRATRIEYTDDLPGLTAEAVRSSGIRWSVVVPIVVDGRVWGSIGTAVPDGGPLPADAEARLMSFTELVATAIANAQSRGELAASRARIIATADATRRRIERDLHDGAQQQLVSLALELRAAQAALPSELDEQRAELSRVVEGLTTVLDELREISSGIHPAILSEGGLGPALRTLARRSPIPVQLEVRVEDRLPESVEVAAYYVVSEMLTNAAKHAHASSIHVDAAGADGVLRVSVQDDGVGGADPARGSGLVGLRDRVEALGGTVTVVSPRNAGTAIEVALPFDRSAEASDRPQKTPTAPAGATG